MVQVGITATKAGCISVLVDREHRTTARMIEAKPSISANIVVEKAKSAKPLVNQASSRKEKKNKKCNFKR